MSEFNFYFAGTMTQEVDEFLIKHNANILRSWFNDLSSIQDLIERKKNGTYGGKLFIDSGAFTAHRKDVEPDCDKYIEFLNDNEQYLECYIQLDKIPGKWGQPRTKEDIKNAEVQSWQNYQYMVSKLKNPYKLLAVFHQDESFDNLKRLLDYKINGQYVPYICISGAKDRAAKYRTDWYNKCYEIIKSSNNPNVKVHCLGCFTIRDLVGFPFTSSDSTTWIQIAAHGGIMDDEILPASTISLNKAENKYTHSIVEDRIRERCKRYNIDYDVLLQRGIIRGTYNISYILDWVKQNKVGSKFNNIKTTKLF